MVLLTRLRELRKYFKFRLNLVAMKTGLSIGYLNRIERGYVSNVKNEIKRGNLEEYIMKLEKRFEADLEKKPRFS